MTNIIKKSNKIKLITKKALKIFDDENHSILPSIYLKDLLKSRILNGKREKAQHMEIIN